MLCSLSTNKMKYHNYVKYYFAQEKVVARQKKKLLFLRIKFRSCYIMIDNQDLKIT